MFLIVLFRTFGLSGRETFKIFATELVVLGGVASGFGVIIGYVLQIVLVDTIAGLLTISLLNPVVGPPYWAINWLCYLVWVCGTGINASRMYHQSVFLSAITRSLLWDNLVGVCSHFLGRGTRIPLQ